MTRAEFLRVLPHAMVGERYLVSEELPPTPPPADRLLNVVVAEDTPRRMGSLMLPILKLQLIFHGYTDDEAADALTRFERAYQRGGG